MQKASLPKGTRDFAPGILKQRQHIISVISAIYVKYGFEPLETPAMENLTTLTGKYGDEGDKLLFKVLNNGDLLRGVAKEQFDEMYDAQPKLLNQISEKGLRYDLTIPFARFVVQNQNDLQFPFKRYQIQPVWRADKPQKGRYREFWQCDADVIGTDSMMCEADFIKIYFEVFTKLGLPHYTLKINHRKILEAIIKTIEFEGKLTDLTVAIDKLDKIGWEGVEKELLEKGLQPEKAKQLSALLTQMPFNTQSLQIIKNQLIECKEAELGLNALQEILDFLGQSGAVKSVEIDLSLARGLDYYTGCIFEAVIEDSGIGSVSGGGRYDDLTGVFGLSNVSGIGISFGIDRIYDVMLGKGLFSEKNTPTAKLLLCHFDAEARIFCNEVADLLREGNIAVEVYPDLKSIRKQLEYANKRGYLFTGVVGSDEINSRTLKLKNMVTGEQEVADLDSLRMKLI